MSDKEYIGEDGLLDDSQANQSRGDAAAAARPCSDRVQLFRRGWTEIVGQLLVPVPWRMSGRMATVFASSKLFVRRVNIWRQTRINSDIRQTIGQIVTDQAPSGEVIEAVLLLEGYPATDLFDFLGRRTRSTISPTPRARQSSTPTAKQLAARSSPRLRAASL